MTILIQVGHLGLGGHRTVIDGLKDGARYCGVKFIYSAHFGKRDVDSIRGVDESFFYVGVVSYLTAQIELYLWLRKIIRSINLPSVIILHGHNVFLTALLLRITGRQFIFTNHNLSQNGMHLIMRLFIDSLAKKTVLINRLQEVLPFWNVTGLRRQQIQNPLAGLERGVMSGFGAVSGGADDVQLELVSGLRFCDQKLIRNMVDTVILANRSMDDGARQVRLTIFGDGPLFKVIQNSYQDAIEMGTLVLPGAVCRERYLQAVRLASAYIQFSVWEADPMSIAEAISLGKIVITNDFKGLDGVPCLRRLVRVLDISNAETASRDLVSALNDSARFQTSHSLAEHYMLSRNPEFVYRAYVEGLT